MFRIILSVAFCVFLYSSSVFAARTIKITVPQSTNFQITNPSDVTVNYDVVCYDQVGVAAATMSGESLVAKATRIYGGGGGSGCAASATPVATSTNSEGLVRCSQASTTFALAPSRCGAFFSLCTIEQVSAASLSLGDQNFWFNINTTSWNFSTNFGSTFSLATSGNQAATSLSSANYCQKGGTTVANCDQLAPAASLGGVVCCPGSSGNLCEVTINTANGYLSSPQFKGGAPF